MSTTTQPVGSTKYAHFKKNWEILRNRTLFLVHHGDFILFTTVIAMTGLGIAILYFSSFNLSMKYTGAPFYFVERQLFWTALAFMLLLSFALIPLDFFFQHSEKLALIILVILLSVFIPLIGKSVSHARRWTNLGVLPFFVQASEVIKPFFAILLAQILTAPAEGRGIEQKRTFFVCAVILSVTLLIALQPDISTALIFLASGAIFFFLSHFSLKTLGGLSILTLPVWLYLVQSKPYIMKRFLFLNPEADPHGSGYHIIRSLSAHRESGWTGQPLDSVFSKLAKLPDAHNDFSFAALTTTSGFLGAFVIVLAFIIILDRGMRIAKAQKERKKMILAGGLVAMISLEAMLHMLVTLGILPTTGTPLPFMSYGGSSLLAHYAMIGILLNLSLPPQREDPSPANPIN